MKNPMLYKMTAQLQEGNTLFETLVYGSLLLSAIALIVFAAVQPVIVQGDAGNKPVTEEHRA
jgi:hypothetical protein